MRIGALTAFLSYLMLIMMSTLMGMSIFTAWPRAAASAARITELVDAEPTVVPPAVPVRDLPARGRIELRGAEFRHPGAENPVLRDVDLVVEPGRTLAVIGSTGSGKTTLLNLIRRLYDASAGTVSVHGVDVRDLDPSELARTVGVVPQRAHLFSGTVATNLRFGAPRATDDELWQALEVAQAAEFVRRLPLGLDAPVAQGGSNLSGGQRQRLSIARALVVRPAVYLFDDSFSALDNATDRALRAALAVATAGATCVVVAQRVSTIRDADRIAVLDGGRVVGLGTHHDLMADNPTYREIVLSQLTEQEAS
jgi:ATP-binding cassette subfamily B protein